MGYHPPLMFGPIAPQNNPPINPQYYKPGDFNISSIVNGMTTLVTTTVNHNYVVGQLVRLIIPEIYGGQQFNEQTANVISVPASNQILIALDSSFFNLFIAHPSSGTTQPQVVAVGDLNTGTINSSGRSSTGTYIPGAFIDISPV